MEFCIVLSSNCLTFPLENTKCLDVSYVCFLLWLYPILLCHIISSPHQLANISSVVYVLINYWAQINFSNFISFPPFCYQYGRTLNNMVVTSQVCRVVASVELFHNYTKFGKDNNKCRGWQTKNAAKIHPVRIELVCSSDALLTELTSHCLWDNRRFRK